MTIYWIYDLPVWLFGLATVAVFVTLSVGGLLLSHDYIKKKFNTSESMNEAVSGYFGGITSLYGLLLGLVIVASWQYYDNASGLVSREEAAIGALYVDVNSYAEPQRTQMREIIKSYVNYIINDEWPAQAHGELLYGGRKFLLDLQQSLLDVDLGDSRKQLIMAEAMQAYNKLIEAHRMRLDAIDDGLPVVLWVIVISGAALSVLVSYFYHFTHFRSHLLMTTALATLAGLMVFLAASVDNPFRGAVSVSPDAYYRLLETWASDSVSNAPSADEAQRSAGASIADH
jgi:hypothetical protein